MSEDDSLYIISKLAIDIKEEAELKIVDYLHKEEINQKFRVVGFFPENTFKDSKFVFLS
jgi:hypothetical protein